MATFIAGAVSVSFTVDRESLQEKREGRVAVQEIPGGDNFYVDRAGRRPLSWSFGLLLESATAWGQLNSAIGEVGTITVELLDPHTAVLMSLTRPAAELDGRTRASAEFLITDA